MSSLFAQVNWDDMLSLGLRVVAVLICIMVHEVCHGLAAYALGDPTAKSMHRLSFNPLRHLDIIGLLMMITVGFGWAKPVPVDPRYFRKPQSGMALTALAGPMSNFVLALLSCVVYRLLTAYAVANVGAVGGFLTLCIEFFTMMILLNIGLGVFNLIPFPPLDGSKILGMVLSERAYFSLMRFERYGIFVLMILLWTGILDGPLYAVRMALVDGMVALTNPIFEGALRLFV